MTIDISVTNLVILKLSRQILVILIINQHYLAFLSLNDIPYFPIFIFLINPLQKKTATHLIMFWKLLHSHPVYFLIVYHNTCIIITNTNKAWLLKYYNIKHIPYLAFSILSTNSQTLSFHLSRFFNVIVIISIKIRNTEE